MKLNRRSILAVLPALTVWPLMAQTEIDLTRQARLEAGVQLPVRCNVGQLFIKSDAPAGSNLYVCTQTNVWSAPAAYSAGVGIAITGGSIATEDAMVPVYYGGTGAPAIDCTAGRDYYVDTSAGALYYCKTNGNWQAVSSAGHTHPADDITSGTLSVNVMPAGVILGNQANSYTAGQRQSVGHDANNAGFRLVPAPGDPANSQDGDLWYNLTTGTFRRRQNGVVSDWGNAANHHLLSSTHDDTTPATAARGDLITAQGAGASWTRLGLGAAGSYLRSNGTDLAYAPISAGDLPGGYSWSNLANVPATFTPSAHGGTHLSNGSDPIPAGTVLVRGTVTTTTADSQVVSSDDSRMTNARTPTAHAATHQNGGSDEIATGTPGAYAIPKAEAGGTLAPGWLPAPSAATLGGVQSKDCSGTGHVQKIGTDGTVTCSVDSGGGGGSTTMAGEYRPFGDFASSSQGFNATAGTVYYFRFTPMVNIPWNSLIHLFGNAASGTYAAFAVMDANCNKISGSDINVTGLQTSGNGWVYAHPSSAPLTLAAGNEYYWATVCDHACSWMEVGGAINPFYYAGTIGAPDVPYFTGSNGATGAGATLAIPSACGTRTKVVDIYRPVIILSTH
jgi:hypothetical protein